VLLVQPDTVLRWHREGFRLFWRRRSRPTRRSRGSPRRPSSSFAGSLSKIDSGVRRGYAVSF
jgi:hypothetical protein